MRKILVTSDFCDGCKKLLAKHKDDVIHSLRTVLILLANGKPIPKKYRDHQLTERDYRELHLSGDDLLLYKIESDDTLIVSLKLSNVTNHKSLNNDSSRTDYEYKEVSTTDLHDITSSWNIPSSKYDHIYLDDFLESLSDYASMKCNSGYILLNKYFIANNELHCEYDYLSYDDVILDDIDFVIDLDEYISSDITELDNYLPEFSNIIYESFEAVDQMI